jgi:hypothetical protein
VNADFSFSNSQIIHKANHEGGSDRMPHTSVVVALSVIVRVNWRAKTTP